MESAWKYNQVLSNGIIHTVQLLPAAHRLVFARKHLSARASRTFHVTVLPNPSGLRLVTRHRGGILRIRLWVTYQPAGRNARSVGFYGLFVAP
jgi:hypothetical protein